MEPSPPSKPRLLLFAFGDFAFNLYLAEHHALSFVLLHGRARPPMIAVAAAIYMAASVWDGIANFVTGALIDRHPPLRFGYARILMLGSHSARARLVLTYVPPPVSGGSCDRVRRSWAHLLFRTAYAG